MGDAETAWNRQRWLLVSAVFTANCVGAGPVMVLSMGSFLKPICAEFGWSRELLSGALLVATTANAFSTPAIGRLLDRFGVRRVLLPAIAVFAALTASISTLTHSRPQLFALFALWGIASAGHAQVPYVTVISNHFVKRRGLALGLGMMGLGVGAMLVPPLVTYLIETMQWRGAYVSLGATTFVIAFSAVYGFVRDKAPLGDSAQRESARHWDGSLRTPGERLALRQVLSTSRQFWRLALAVFLLSLGINGVLGHVAPMLTDRGIEPHVAALIAGSVGLATISSRVFSGWLVDRFKPPYVAAAFFLFPLIGVAVLASGSTSEACLVFAMCTIGLGFGAEADIVGVLVGRYFELRHFGQVFGMMAFAFSIGVGIGPWLMSVCYDVTKSYSLALGILGLGFAVAGFLAARLDIGRPVSFGEVGDAGKGPNTR